MEAIRELFVLLGVDVRDADFDKAEKEIEKVKDMARTAAYVVGGLSVAVAALTNDFVRNAEFLARWRARVGGTIEDLSGLQTAAGQAGFEAEKAFEGIAEVAERASDVVENVKELTGDAGESFKALGFSMEDLKGPTGEVRNAQELFREVVRRLSEIENQGRRTGIAMRIFGDDVGLQLVPFIERMGGNLDDVIERAKTLGAVMTEDDVRAAHEFRAAWSGVISVLRGFGFVLGRAVTPVLTRHLSQVTDWIIANRRLVRQRVDTWVDRLQRALDYGITKTKQYVGAVDDAAMAVGGWEVVLTGISVLLGGLFLKRIGTAILAVNGFRVALTAAGVKAALVGGLFALVVLIIDEVITAARGGETALGRFVKAFGPESLGPDSGFFAKALATWIGLIESMTTALAAFWVILTGTRGEMNLAIQDLQTMWDPVVEIWQGDLDAFADWVSRWTERLLGVFDGFGERVSGFARDAIARLGSSIGISNPFGGAAGALDRRARGGLDQANDLLGAALGGRDPVQDLVERFASALVVNVPTPAAAGGGGVQVNLSQTIAANGDEAVARIARDSAREGLNEALQAADRETP